MFSLHLAHSVAANVIMFFLFFRSLLSPEEQKPSAMVATYLRCKYVATIAYPGAMNCAPIRSFLMVLMRAQA